MQALTKHTHTHTHTTEFIHSNLHLLYLLDLIYGAGVSLCGPYGMRSWNVIYGTDSSLWLYYITLQIHGTRQKDLRFARSYVTIV